MLIKYRISIQKATVPIEHIKSPKLQIENWKDASKCHHEKTIMVCPKWNSTSRCIKYTGIVEMSEYKINKNTHFVQMCE